MPILSVSFAQGTDVVDPEFTVLLDEAAPGPVQVSYRTLPLGSAIEGSDWAQTNGTLIIPAGLTSGTIPINTFSSSETVDENFTIELFNPVGVDFPDGATVIRQTGVILEGSAPALFVSDPILVEDDSGTTLAEFEVRLSRSPSSTLNFTYETIDGTAEAGSDYVAKTGSFTLGPGNLTETISVVVNGDTDIEPSEYFSLVVTPDASAKLVLSNEGADSAGIAEILDDDANTLLPVINISPVLSTDVTDAEFIVYLDKASVGPVQVSFRTVTDTAFEGLDFANTAGTLIIPAGETSATISVNTFSSSEALDEAYTLELFDPVGGTLAGGTDVIQTTGVILEGSNRALFVSDPVLLEEDSGTTTADFEVRLSRPSSNDLTFTYMTVDASAKAGSDYVAKSGTLTFKAGQTVANISVDILGDTDIEPTEYFSLVVTPDLSAALQVTNSHRDGAGIAEIRGDDSASVLPVVTVSPATATDVTNTEFTVSLDEPSVGQVQVSFRTINNTAFEGSDFSQSSGTLIIPAGKTTGVISINTFSSSESVDESFTLEVFDPIGAVLAGDTSKIAVSGIIREGSAPALFVSEPDVIEGDSGTKNAVFKIELSTASSSDLTLNYTTADGSAQAGSDYTAVSGTLVMKAGQTIATVEVPILGDGIVEPSEFFSLVVTPDIFAASIINNDPRDLSGIAEIFDDDAGTASSLPTISVSPARGTDVTNPEFSVTLDRASTGPVEVSFRTLSYDTGRAVEGSDYPITEGSLVIPAGETTGTISINTASSSEARDENFTLELFSPVGAVLAGGEEVLRVTGVIYEGSLPALFVGDPVLVEGDSGTTDAVFEVRLSRAASNDLTINYTTVDGTAQAGDDYIATSGTLVIPKGQIVTAIRVPVIGDGQFEESESFSLVLTPDIFAATQIDVPTADGAGIATILDNEAGGALPTISILPAVGTDVTDPQFVLRLDKASVGPVEVSYRSVSGTAIENSDFSAVDTTIIIPAGETTATVSINSFSSSESNDEFFTLEFFNPVNAELEGRSDTVIVTGTILEGFNTSMFVSPTLAYEDDDNAVFEIRLSTPSANDITLSYTTQDGSAVAGADYVAQSGTVTFLAGQTLATVFVPIISTTASEANETFSLVVTPTTAIGNGSTGAFNTATIIDSPRPVPTGFETFNGLPGEGPPLDFFGSFSAAQSAVPIGGSINVLNPVAVGDIGNASITKNNLIVQADAGFEADFNLAGGVTNFGMFGNADMNASGQGLANTITGNSGDNELAGNSGNDTLRGLGGEDTLEGGDDDDRLEGGQGDDSLDGGDQNDELFGGGSGEDTLLGGRGSDFLFGENGDDTLEGGDGFDLLNGGTDDDLLRGGNGNDRLLGNLGNDTLEGDAGNDTLFGGPSGNDELRGGDNDDQLFGEAGKDFLAGDDGNDTLNGGTNDDTLLGGNGDDSLIGGAGNDSLFGGPTGADTLDGGQGSDFLFAESADDLLIGGDGFDLMNGGAGDDSMLGGNGGDRLEGNLGEDTLDGGSGNDELFGGNGAFADTLIGGTGNDTLFGEAGADTFVFEDGFGVDEIRDFQLNGGDVIDLAAVSAITSFADLQTNHLSQDGADALITDGANSIRLTGIDENDLTTGDFDFLV